MRRLLGLVWSSPSCLLDYLPRNTCVAIDERNQGYAHGKQWLDHVNEHYQEIISSLEDKEINVKANFPNSLVRNIESCYILAEQFDGFDLQELFEEKASINQFNLSNRSLASYPNQFGKLSTQIKDFQTKKNFIWLVSAQPSRTVALLEEHDCVSKFVPNSTDFSSAIEIN